MTSDQLIDAILNGDSVDDVIENTLNERTPEYNITVKDALKGWLNLDKKTIYTATRHVGTHGSYWSIDSIKKDVPDWNIHVIQSDKELQSLIKKGYKQA